MSGVGCAMGCPMGCLMCCAPYRLVFARGAAAVAASALNDKLAAF